MKEKRDYQISLIGKIFENIIFYIGEYYQYRANKRWKKYEQGKLKPYSKTGDYYLSKYFKTVKWDKKIKKTIIEA